MLPGESTPDLSRFLRIHSVEERGMVLESAACLEAGDVITLGLEGGEGIPCHRAECLVVDCREQQRQEDELEAEGTSHLVTVAFCGISPAAYQYLQHLKAEVDAEGGASPERQGHHAFPPRYRAMAPLSIRTIRQSGSTSAPDAR